jgi:hypothetical protein
MAKVQGKKTAVAKPAASRAAARPKAATAVKKAAKKPVAPKARAAKTKPAPKPAPKPVAKAKTVVKTALKAVKALVKPAPKAAAKPPAKPVLTPKAVKPAPAPKVAPKVAAKVAPKAAVAKVQPKPAAKPVAVAVAAPPRPAAPARPAPVVDDKKRARRPRPRVTPGSGPAANWLHVGEKPRPSSFMPAPPRAEAPSLVAAPPASSDRLIRNEDLIAPNVRTVPVRLDIEAASGRVYIYPNPLEVSLKPGEGIEWDFRYLGGADVTVDEVVIEFEKPSPFPQQVFRCRKPGIGRPQRQLSGGAAQTSSGRRVQYTVHAMTAFKTELGVAKLSVLIG